MLRLGSRGDAVKALQKKLGITADGIFGPQTEAALKAWQKKNGLTADGVYGPKSQAKMGGGSTASSSGGGTVSSGGPSGTADEAMEMAAGFGYSLSFFDADPELKKLLNKALSSSPPMTQNRFIAELQNTKWFRTHGESYRKYIALLKSDPKTLKQLQGNTQAQILQVARQIGAHLTSSQLAKLADYALQFGWTAEQQRNALLSYVSQNKDGSWSGDAGSAATRYKAIADDYGITLSTGTLGSFVKNTIKGSMNEATVQQWAAAQAASKYPALAQQLKAGQTLRQLADPYVQSYAEILELNPEAIKLGDTLLQKALTSKDAKGQPAVKTIWQFEQDLRSDPRWNKTQKAQDDVMSTARRVLQDFGFSQ